MPEARGIVTPSSYTVNETVDRLRNILHSKGGTLFALVDHRGAATVGLTMPATKLLIFASPRAGILCRKDTGSRRSCLRTLPSRTSR